MKKRILFLSPLPPPNYGSALSSQEILGFLRKNKNLEVKNIRLNYSRDMSDVGKITFSKLFGIKTVKNQIKKAIKEFKPDLIYLMPATDNLGTIRDYLFFKEIRRYTKKKILFHIRTRIPEKNWKNPVFKKIYNNIFTDKNSHFILLGEELISDFKGLIQKNKNSLLPNAIKNEITDKQLAKIIKQRQKIKIPNVLFLSNMDKTKGWPKLLQACKILDEKDLKFRCYFAGAWQNKKDETFFFNFVNKNDLKDKVFYAGKAYGKDKLELFKKSHMLVFPTEYKLETFGRVIVEAMMFSIPVIANSIATIPSIVQDRKTGFLLKHNTPEEIAERLEFLIKNSKQTEKIGKEGRKRFLKNFELKDYEKKFIEILNKT